jgi:hypothetical protein
VTSTIHMNMHNEHRLWGQEISLWRDDLHAWQGELAQAQQEMTELKTAFETHGTVLRKHASSLRLEESTIDAHEHEIAAYERQGEGDELFEMARTHAQEGVDHVRHRQLHEELKRRHHSVIAHWNLLRKALAESQPPVLGSAIPAHSPQTTIAKS